MVKHSKLIAAICLTAVVLLGACSPRKQAMPVYAWQIIGAHTNIDSLRQDFSKWKSHGVTGVCIETANLEQTREAAAAAHAEGLEFHASVPSMKRKDMPHEWYAVNRLGQSADQFPSYVRSYRFLDPANPDVQEFLLQQYLEIASIPEVDYVRLDFIRYPDVILAQSLHQLYGIEQTDGEYAPADYCYCANCARMFLEQTGIDITRVEDPSTVRQWAQFRCDQLTFFVDKIARAVHDVGKKVSVDVFPGPYTYADHVVRQQWDQWTVDMFFPMNFNEYFDDSIDWLGEAVSEEVDAAGNVPVICNLKMNADWKLHNPGQESKASRTKHYGLLPGQIGDAIRCALESGADGICLTSPYRMSPEHWQALEEALK